MDYYQLLGVSPHCDRETLHKAFRELSLKFHPDRYTETARKLAEKRYQQMVVAFNTLKDRKLRARYDRMNNIAKQVSQMSGAQGQASPAGGGFSKSSTGGISINTMDPKDLAKKHFQAGVAKFEAKQWAQALEHFEAAEDEFGQNPQYHYLRGNCELHVPAAHRHSVASLQKAVQLQPSQVKYHVALIKALAGFGLKSRVTGALDRALQALPDSPEILALDQQFHPEKYKKGLFGNLFGKK